MTTFDRGAKPAPFLRRAPLALTLAVAATLGAGTARADIDPTPATIVDHGTYITDTVAHRDWYKFSNTVNTLGISFEAALAAFAPLGWSGASLDQVQGLETRFGWTADTPFFSVNPNYGLTYAMSALLGETSTVYFDAPAPSSDEVHSIQAVTTDRIYFFDGSSGRVVTASQTELVSSPREGNIYFGDYVVGLDGVLADNAADGLYGVWLTRESIPTIPAVPEPGVWGLMSLGLLGLFMRRRAMS